MTNAQTYLQEAIEASLHGKLSTWESSFVESIMEQYGEDPESHDTKKALRGLSSKQFLTLRKIANKNN